MHIRTVSLVKDKASRNQQAVARCDFRLSSAGMTTGCFKEVLPRATLRRLRTVPAGFQVAETAAATDRFPGTTETDLALRNRSTSMTMVTAKAFAHRLASPAHRPALKLKREKPQAIAETGNLPLTLTVPELMLRLTECGRSRNKRV